MVDQDKVHISQVTYTYPRQKSPTLKGIDLRVGAGEILAIMGATGAGKTSLVSLVNGLIPQYFEGQMRGRVTVDGLSTYESRIQTLVQHVGLVLQDPETQIFGITVFEDTAFGPSNLGWPLETIRAKVSEALSNVRLAGYEDRMTSYLSGGEKQRLAIAGVLAMEPDVLVLDESTSELDPVGRAEVIEIVESLRREKHTTVILVEHEPEDVLRLADRLAVVAEGEIVWYGRPAQLFRDVAFTQKLSIRSPQMAQLGYELSQAGLIALDEIPLSVDEAEPLVRRVVAGKRLGVESDGHGSSNEEDRTPVIEVKGLTHTYQGGIQALSGINLTIRQGEFVAAVGQNGAGKTTLVKHFNGLLKPTSGTVLVQGLDTKDHEVRELARHVGYVFQNPDHQIFCSTVAEEIGYGLRNLGMSEDEREQRISDALGVVGLESKRDQHPFNLGKGERQKVAVASILAISPPIIVIDEPTTGLDWAGIAAMMNLIQDLHRQGHTIIMVTHNMQIVAEYAQRVIVMSSGKVSMDGPPDDVFTDISDLHQASLEPTPMNVLARRLGDLGCPSNVLTVGQMMQAITHAGIQG